MKYIEDAIEQAYWEFDSMKAKGEFSERDCFKMVCRALSVFLDEDPVLQGGEDDKNTVSVSPTTVPI